MLINPIRVQDPTGTTGTPVRLGISPMAAMSSGVPVASEDWNSVKLKAELAPEMALFVSTSLSQWFTVKPERFHRDVQVNDVAYRRLDPEYYAWLRSRMNLARLAALAGQLDQDEFDALRDRFNRIHEWAMAQLGEAALEAAVRGLDSRDYLPPAIEPWDRHVASPAAGQSGSQAEAVAMVDAIRETAITLGWKQERLYTAGRPLSPLCGLAAYLNPGDRLGEVTREAIEIILPSGVRQHLYNPDVEQPWVKRIKS